jgi:hypothetical protein
MTFIAVQCPHWDSEQSIKRGKTRRGTQRYLCQNTACATGSFLLVYRNRGCLPEVKHTIIDMSLHASGIRDTARVLRISTDTVPPPPSGVCISLPFSIAFVSVPPRRRPSPTSARRASGRCELARQPPLGASALEALPVAWGGREGRCTGEGNGRCCALGGTACVGEKGRLKCLSINRTLINSERLADCPRQIPL